MMRRRRGGREIPFSFDSFLDIVANVVGIIIRLILVVWVGARSYSSLQMATATPAPVKKALPVLSAPADPLQEKLRAHTRELAQTQERLLAQLRQWQQAQEAEKRLETSLVVLASHIQQLQGEEDTLTRTATVQATTAQALGLTSAELRRRS